MTAQQIADRLGISIEEAELAVLSPIGDEIQVATPDLSRLSQNGTKVSNTAVLTFPVVGATVLVIGAGIILYITVSNGQPTVKARGITGEELWEKTGDAAQDLLHRYLPNYFPSNSPINPPKRLPGFPDAQQVKPKTSVQGGGKLRKRWKIIKETYMNGITNMEKLKNTIRKASIRVNLILILENRLSQQTKIVKLNHK
jgi:Cytotoxic